MQILFHEAEDITTGLGVPYPKNDSLESTNIGYFDIKQFPKKISQIPELRGWLDLEDLIKFINSPKSLFRTLRCDIAQSKINHSGFRNKITSYVTVAFEILEWNVKDNFKQLSEEFIDFAKPDYSITTTVIEFELIPTSYNQHAFTAWSIDIWNHGFGLSKKEAKKNWLNGIRILKAFIDNQNLKYGQQLTNERKTIGINLL